ncbi:hypothetical protein DAEQUDRAFT_733592, partial [Daedalea quercina L-15889]
MPKLVERLSSRVPSRGFQVYPPSRPERKSHPLPDRPAPTQPSKPLAERLSEPTPIARSVDFDLKTKSKGEICAILETKVSATIKRFQAVFDKKHLFDRLPSHQQTALHRFADQLNWAINNIDSAHKWSQTDR